MIEQNITAQELAEQKQNSEGLSSGMKNGLESEPSVIATADALLEQARLQYSNHQKTVDQVALVEQLEEGGMHDLPDIVSSPAQMQKSPHIKGSKASHSTSITKNKRLLLQASAGISQGNIIESQESGFKEEVMSGPLPDDAIMRMHSDSPEQKKMVYDQAFNSVPRRSGKYTLVNADGAQQQEEVDEELILLAAAMNGKPLPDNEQQSKKKIDSVRMRSQRGQEARGSVGVIEDSAAPIVGKHQRKGSKGHGGGRRRSQGNSISSAAQVGLSNTKDAPYIHQKVITQHALVYLRGNSHHAYAPQSSSLNGIRSVGGGLHISGPAPAANARKKKMKQRNNQMGLKDIQDQQLMLPPIPLVASQVANVSKGFDGARKKSPPVSSTAASQKMSSITNARNTYDSANASGGGAKQGSLKPLLQGASRTGDKQSIRQLSKSQSNMQGESTADLKQRRPTQISPLKHQNSEVMRQRNINNHSPKITNQTAQPARRRFGQGQSLTRQRPSGGPPVGFSGQVLPAPGASPLHVKDDEDENQKPVKVPNSASRYDAGLATGDASFMSIGTTGKQQSEKAGALRNSDASVTKQAPFISGSNEASGGKLRQPRRSRSPLSQRNLNVQDGFVEPVNEEGTDELRKKVDYERKNLERLEALKAKKAAEIQQMEAEREKTKRRQEKLAAKILREAEANRQRKAEQAAKEEQEPEVEEKQDQKARRRSQSPSAANADGNEECEAEQQKKLAMMRRFYRNRHATFIKTLLEKKRGQKENEEERKQKEEKIKQKVREKALAKLNANDDLTTNVPQQRHETVTTKPRGSSMSARQSNYKAFNAINDSTSIVTTNQSSGGNKIDPPSSKEQKQRQMCKAYGMGVNQLVSHEKKRGRMVRVNSRGSVRSQKSTQSATPIINRSSAMAKIGQGLEELVMEPPEIFDEEREQAELEEARKRKERAKKMREQQQKMLAEIQAKKEAAEREEEEKRRKYEKKLAKAREQAKANAEAIPEKSPAQPEETAVEKKKPPRQPFNDKNCLQAPDNEESPVKKEKKPFIEPDLKAFLERNMPNLKVFANITDMKTWKKKHQVDDDAKVFIVTGGYGFLKKSLRKRGWIENKDPNSPCFDLKWTLKSKDINHNTLQDTQLVNHFPKAQAITTKVGLMHNLKNLIWFNNIDIETFYPRCYDLALTEEQDDFAQEYMAVKAECHLKRFVRELRESAQAAAEAAEKEPEDAEGEGDGNDEEQKVIEIKTSVKEKVVKLAIKICERRLKDLNEMIDDPKAFTHLVSPEEWKILGADELNEKKLQKQKHEKRLQSLNMPLPPRSKKKKKRKRLEKGASKTKVTTPGYEAQEAAESSEEEDDVEVEDDDEQAALDKAIAKKFPDFKQAVQIIADLKKTFPQTSLNGEKNIWIIKPAQSSRGRGIVLMKNLVQIMEVCKQQEFQFIAQKYIENPLIIKNRKFDLRVWVLVTDWNPLTIWLFKKPYVRLPAHDYDPMDIDNNFAHLANNSIAKYGSARQNMYEIEGNMMFVEELQEYLLNLHCSDIYEDVIEEKIRQVVINTLESVQDTFEYKRGCFELYGFDIMVDDEFNCWLIEVNSSPAMDYSTHVTEKLVKQCLEDTVKVIVDYEVPRTAKKKAQVDTGEYELIYKASRVVEKPLNTFGLNLDVVGKKIPDKHLNKY